MAALEKIPFELETRTISTSTPRSSFSFYAEAIAYRKCLFRLTTADEICRVDGIKYAFDVIKATLIARAQDLGILYDRKYDVRVHDEANVLYVPKFGFESPHTLALEHVAPGARVLDIGCASGYMARALKQKGCEVTGIELVSSSSRIAD